MWTRARRLAEVGRANVRRSEARRSRCESGKRTRRGATLVFVAVFALALVGVAAFAIDASRLYVGTNELQTGADAAALRAARYMQSNQGDNPTDSAIAFATSNEALGSSVTLASQDVSAKYYSPEVGLLDTTWLGANAVEVRASGAGTLLFGRLLTSVMPSPTRRSVAWVANINRISCPAPLGFPMEALNSVLYGASDNIVRPDLYSELLARQGTPFRIAMVLYPSGATEPKESPNGAWDFKAIDNTEGPGGNGMDGYADQLAGVSCNANSTTEIDSTEVFKGKGKGSVDQKTWRSAHNNQGGPNNGQTFCEPGFSPVCFPKLSGGIGDPGVVRDVSWIGSVTGGSAPVKTIGGFKVICVFEGKKGKSESCPWYDNYRASGFAQPGLPDDLPQGTIVGYPVPTTPGLGAGTELGSAPSTGQRLILVR